MSDALPVKNEEIQCPYCNEPVARTDSSCVACGGVLNEVTPLSEPLRTLPLQRRPSTTTKSPTDANYFDHDTKVIVQVLPSGTCLTLSIDKSTVLGRQKPGDDREFCDLTEFQGYQHGVSRQHCTLRRLGNQLLVSDLQSSNGTYLNGLPVPPFTERTISHGDKLILGSLHLIITFVSS